MGIMGTPGIAGLLVVGVHVQSHGIGSPPLPVLLASQYSQYSQYSQFVRAGWALFFFRKIREKTLEKPIWTDTLHIDPDRSGVEEYGS